MAYVFSLIACAYSIVVTILDSNVTQYIVPINIVAIKFSCQVKKERGFECFIIKLLTYKNKARQ